MSRKSKNQYQELRKLFVLDTSVILYDHQAVLNFQEHDVAIPITVLEELDNFKKGNDTINFEARQFIRYIDGLSQGNPLSDWIILDKKRESRLKVVMEIGGSSQLDATKLFGDRKADHLILNAALKLQEEYPQRKVILVTKDMNLRLKARSMNLHSEDYETGKIKDVDGLYKGITRLELETSEVIDMIHKDGSVHYSAIIKSRPEAHHYYILRNHKSSILAYFNPENDNFERVEKRLVHGIKPKNAEQAFAIHALLNSSVKLVTIQGVAGTGKTLLALASALEQKSEFIQIYLARPIVPLNNKEIGFLPGDAGEKVGPYMEPLLDNLKVIQNQYKENSKDYQRIKELVSNEKLLVAPLAFIRGRSLNNIYFIVDEAQNLTPLEVKTIISRAGEGTKIVFTGDIHQIDTPYLDTESNGLSYIIDRLKGQKIYTHVTLEKGERSELANLANELL
jgi:PhoH-like ATPase